MVSVQHTTWRPLVIFGGISGSKETDLAEYREGNYLDVNKAAAIEIDGMPILRRALLNYKAARQKSTGIGPIYILGEEQHIFAAISSHESQQYGVEVISGNSSLGDKLRAVQQIGNAHPDELVHIAPVDVAPTVPDLEQLQGMVNRHEQYDFISAGILGQPLVENGFRKNLREKIYVVRNGARGIDHVAFPQLHTLRPEYVHLNLVARLTDASFAKRGAGITRTIKTLGRIIREERARSGIPRRGTVARILTQAARIRPRKKFKPRMVPSYTVLAKTLGRLCYRGDDAAFLGRLDAPTLAMDVDTKHERSVLDSVYTRKFTGASYGSGGGPSAL